MTTFCKTLFFSYSIIFCLVMNANAIVRTKPSIRIPFICKYTKIIFSDCYIIVFLIVTFSIFSFIFHNDFPPFFQRNSCLKVNHCMYHKLCNFHLPSYKSVIEASCQFYSFHHDRNKI